MNTPDDIENRPEQPWLQRLEANVRDTFATLLRPPKPQSPALAPLSSATWSIGALFAVTIVAGAMVLLDAWSAAGVQNWPPWLLQPFERLSDAGLSGWFLWPSGILLILLALIDTKRLPRFTHGVLAAIAVRTGFVFLAIGLPGLFVTIVKRLIGRARPGIDDGGVWAYQPFGWNVEYASLPSGHATTAFSVLVSLGAIFPEARPILWIYAVLVALSRVALTAHFPSDVIAGAIVGALGALLVRNWFARRRLGFVVARSGKVVRLPGPGMPRIKAVARRLFSA